MMQQSLILDSDQLGVSVLTNTSKNDASVI